MERGGALSANRSRVAEAPAETPNPNPVFSDNPDSVCRRAHSGKPTPRFRQNRGPECRNRGVGGCGLPESWRRWLQIAGAAARGTAGASAAGHDAHERYVLLAPAATGHTIGTFQGPEAYRSCALSRKAPRKRTLWVHCRSGRTTGRNRRARAAAGSPKAGRSGAGRWIRRSEVLTNRPASQPDNQAPASGGTAGRGGAGVPARWVRTGPTTGRVNSAHVRRSHREAPRRPPSPRTNPSFSPRSAGRLRPR